HALGVSAELKVAFKTLDAHLYQAGDKPDTAEMADMLTSLRRALLASFASTNNSKTRLEPLYPA
ncbi:MAG: hypothetical protein ACJA2E_001268, partial [Arenicella sp.]